MAWYFVVSAGPATGRERVWSRHRKQEAAQRKAVGLFAAGVRNLRVVKGGGRVADGQELLLTDFVKLSPPQRDLLLACADGPLTDMGRMTVSKDIRTARRLAALTGVAARAAGASRPTAGRWSSA
jgi:hypothetical protein